MLAVPLMVQGAGVQARSRSTIAPAACSTGRDPPGPERSPTRRRLALENARLYTGPGRPAAEAAEDWPAGARALTGASIRRRSASGIAEGVLALFQVQIVGAAAVKAGRLAWSPWPAADRRRRGSPMRENDHAGGRRAPRDERRPRRRPSRRRTLFNDPSLVTDRRGRRRACSAPATLPCVAGAARAKDRIIGTLSLGDAAGRVFTEAEVGLLQAFGDQAALALENARLFSLETARRGQIRRASPRPSAELAPELDPGRLLTLIIRRATRLFSAPGVIYLADAGGIAGAAAPGRGAAAAGTCPLVLRAGRGRAPAPSSAAA